MNYRSFHVRFHEALELYLTRDHKVDLDKIGHRVTYLCDQAQDDRVFVALMYREVPATNFYSAVSMLDCMKVMLKIRAEYLAAVEHGKKELVCDEF